MKRVRNAEGDTRGEREEVLTMAETSKGKKFIRVQAYARADGTNVHTHDRSTPKTSHGAKRPSRSGHR